MDVASDALMGIGNFLQKISSVLMELEDDNKGYQCIVKGINGFGHPVTVTLKTKIGRISPETFQTQWETVTSLILNLELEVLPDEDGTLIKMKVDE